MVLGSGVSFEDPSGTGRACHPAAVWYNARVGRTQAEDSSKAEDVTLTSADRPVRSHQPSLPPTALQVEEINGWLSRFSPLPQSVESIEGAHDPLMGESTVMWKPTDPSEGAEASNVPDHSSPEQLVQ